MPRGPRKSTQLTRAQIESLLYGSPLIWCDRPPFQNDEERRQAWLDNRDWLLSLQGVERVPGLVGCYPLKQGEKPQAFYDYEKGKR